jgi:hypothetical protein
MPENFSRQGTTGIFPGKKSTNRAFIDSRLITNGLCMASRLMV